MIYSYPDLVISATNNNFTELIAKKICIVDFLIFPMVLFIWVAFAYDDTI
jgi:hypothetical protein